MRQQYGNERAKAIYSLTIDNHNLLYEQIIKPHSINCGYTRCGSITAAVTNEEYDELLNSHRLLCDDNFQCELIDETMNAKLEVRGFKGGLQQRIDGGINPVLFIEGIKSFLSDKVSIIEHCEVFDIRSESGELNIRAESAAIKCDLAILATNGYAPLLSSFLKGKVTPTRGQVLALSATDKKLFDGHTIYCDFGFEYFRQLSNGVVLLGGFRQNYRAEELGYSDETTESIQMGLEEFISGHIPTLVGQKITHRWSGIMGFSADGLPLVGEIPGHPGVMYIGGYTGHGLGFAVVLTKALAEQLLNGKTDYPLEIFSLRRLG